MQKKTQRGFTLIEILIVVAIIAILASVVLVGLGPTQQQGRDARRISDLRETQTALELYFNKCGFYPGGANCAAASDDTWATMSSAITDQKTNIGISQIPTDPTNSGTHVYYYGQESGGTSYVIGAVLENSNNSVFNGYQPPVLPVGGTLPTGLKSCTEVDNEYCLSI
jgi:prepilin-type N-terminal cleavage/methylation domain-containing protein